MLRDRATLWTTALLLGLGCSEDSGPSLGGADAGPQVPVADAGLGGPDAQSSIDASATPPVPICGDGKRDLNEQCDGADLGGLDCVAAGFASGGALSCRSDCSLELSGCTGPGPVCGDGSREGAEQCDGADLGGESCVSLGFAAGELGCRPGCLFELGLCVPRDPPPGAVDGLDTDLGCPGVYNPDQVLSYRIEIAPGDWSALLADLEGTTYFSAQLSCESLPPITVGLRRKRSGGSAKPGLKIDINRFVPGQRYYDLTKMSFEVGASSGGSSESSVQDLVAEYLGNRLMVLSGAYASRASFAEIEVNGQLLGVMVNVEQIDKRFLLSRLGENDGWLTKKSGSPGDGLKTNVGVPNPYEAYFCFFAKNGCAMPSASELASTLPLHLDIEQLLRVGAVNALMANTDSPLLKDNNYFFYDSDLRPRLYFAWDLDTSMRDDYGLFDGQVPGGVEFYRQALYSNWEGEYDRVLTDLLSGALSLAAIQAELDRALSVAGPALDADPHAGSNSAAAIGALGTWWSARHGVASAEAAAH